MSCRTCGSSQHSAAQCYEARLSLGVNTSKTQIQGSLDRVSIKPIPIQPFVQANETTTTLKYDPDKRSLVYQGEPTGKRGASANYVKSSEILSGSDISELGGVGALTQGGIGLATLTDNELRLLFSVPSPVEVGESSGGFITYVAKPNDGKSFLRTIQPELGGNSDSVLIGHPDGSLEFSTPLASPLRVSLSDLTGSGHFAGNPSKASGSWRYQQMGTSQTVSNTSGSRVAVTLNFRYSLETAGAHSGVYASLANNGADYQTRFIGGRSDSKQEGYPGGYAEFTCVLDANQKCQFLFGAWTDAAGNMVVTIGSIDEDGGDTIYTVNPPTISIRRLV
jgi:hypothetical protein